MLDQHRFDFFDGLFVEGLRVDGGAVVTDKQFLARALLAHFPAEHDRDAVADVFDVGEHV